MRILGQHIRFIDLMIIVNVFVYIMGLGTYSIPDNFGLWPAMVFTEPWRMITSMFIHGSFGHLLMNMLALYFFGMWMERIVSEREVINIYFIGGIAGSLFYVFFAFLTPFASIDTIAVGASGALFAVGGALAVMKPNIRVLIFPFPVPLPLWQAEIVIFFLVSFFPNVAWEGHLGGLIAGAILGYYYKKKVIRVPEIVYFTTRHY
ncbi:MAG: rhomboid family intramembrane serine protease [Candidatus Altiarchaeota archaeon]|nr:rhomboid family intramembrane serine protease [Candidatus Altiarchaeota archaeon]